MAKAVDRQPKDFDQMNPPKDITDPDGLGNPKFPVHVHRVNHEPAPDAQVLTIGGYPVEFRTVADAQAHAAASKDGFQASPHAAIQAHEAKAKKGKKDAE